VPARDATLTHLADFRPRAVVFDLDGTLAQNMPIHAEAFAEFVARHDLPPFTLERRRELDGKRNSEIFPVLFDRALTEDEWRAFEHEKESLYREVGRGRVQALAGAAALLEALDAKGVRAAVATSAPADNVAFTLREIGLERLLDQVVRGDQVPRGKPFPDVFLEAARQLGVAPGQCLAFEDAPMGVEAAISAGMRCVAVATSFDAHTLLASRVPPTAVVSDFDEFLAGDGRWLLAP
jgi:HAD superfamily hydrolase (TIGR01509 family)